jgi:hypothetical protein
MTAADPFLIKLYNRLWRAIEARDKAAIEKILFEEWPRCSYDEEDFSNEILANWKREVEKADKILFPDKVEL